MLTHPYFWTIVVPIVISALISLFAREIRTGMGAAFRRGGKSLKEGTISDLENRLGVINWVHGNAYNFLLWLSLEARLLLITTMVIAFAAMSLRVLNKPTLSTLCASLIFGAWVGRLTRISELLVSLQNYDRSKKKLEEKISYFKREWRDGQLTDEPVLKK